jgi:hypothetical protein
MLTLPMAPAPRVARRPDSLAALGAGLRAAGAAAMVAHERLLTAPQAQPKAVRGVTLNVWTAVLHLAPAGAAAESDSDAFTVCPWSTHECRAACLYTAGRAAYLESVNRARVRRTRLWRYARGPFLARLVTRIGAHQADARRRGMLAAVRLNGTSDIAWESHAVRRGRRAHPSIMHAYPAVQFYDYTKSSARVLGGLTGTRPLPANYHLTYSHSEAPDSREASRRVLELGGNVAVVFDVSGTDGRLPTHWQGYRVIDATQTDARFADGPGVVAGLRTLGRARGMAAGGFIVDAAECGELADREAHPHIIAPAAPRRRRRAA